MRDTHTQLHTHAHAHTVTHTHTHNYTHTHTLTHTGQGRCQRVRAAADRGRKAGQRPKVPYRLSSLRRILALPALSMVCVSVHLTVRLTLYLTGASKCNGCGCLNPCKCMTLNWMSNDMLWLPQSLQMYDAQLDV